MHKPENDLPWSFREINTIENMSFNQRLFKKKRQKKKNQKEGIYGSENTDSQF